ncbi:MAG: hypothetical protein RR014_02365 [Bilophila sp.]
MTKQQRFVSRLQLSRVCRWILTLAALKLAMLAFMVLLPGADPTQEAGQTSEHFLTDLLHEAVPVRGQIAHAAEVSPGTAVTPPAPKIRSGQNQSPFAQQPASNPAATPGGDVNALAPAPQVSPFVPRDSAQRKQEELNRREQELLALQQQMETRLDELKNLEGKIQDMLKQANNVQDDKLKHLIDVYSNMKAKQAAEVLATLDERIAVRILAGMRGKQAGEILTYMQAAPAAKLSELLSRTQLP